MKPGTNWAISLLAFGFMLGGALGASAQTATNENGQREALPPVSSDQLPSVPEQGKPNQLSAAPKGVIAPPKTGDANVIPPPSAGPGATPVIRPPGTPGGDQDIQPK